MTFRHDFHSPFLLFFELLHKSNPFFRSSPSFICKFYASTRLSRSKHIYLNETSQSWNRKLNGKADKICIRIKLLSSRGTNLELWKYLARYKIHLEMRQVFPNFPNCFTLIHISKLKIFYSSSYCNFATFLITYAHNFETNQPANQIKLKERHIGTFCVSYDA